MRSSELAALAGVTVRALRHYHQLGILDEPLRGPNGYRRYDVHDLIRVLRIRRLAAVGIPLERMRGLLDDSEDDAGRLLETLDRELAEQIDRATEQRRLIALLRDQETSPDVPPELGRFLAAFAATGSSPTLAGMDRDLSVLLAHLVGESGMPRLAGIYERLADPELLSATAVLSARFEELGPEAGDEEVDALVEDFATALEPVVREFAEQENLPALEAAAGLFADYRDELLSEAQWRVLERLEARLGSTPPPPGEA